MPNNNLHLNVNGGIYVNGIPYSMDAHVRIVRIYEDLKASSGGFLVPITRVAKVAGCSLVTAEKIVRAHFMGQYIQPK